MLLVLSPAVKEIISQQLIVSLSAHAASVGVLGQRMSTHSRHLPQRNFMFMETGSVQGNIHGTKVKDRVLEPKLA